jgi:hypothetical protein
MTDILSGGPAQGPFADAPGRERPAWLRRLLLADRFDLATAALVAALLVIALATFRAYAITNDEGVQHRYAELIAAYYRSGLADRRVFSFENLYLYGGLFDLCALLLSQAVPLEVFALRHLLCAMAGIGGIAAAAGVARQIAGPRAGLFAALALATCGAWYGAMFNHTKDVPLAAAMAAAAFFLIRCARSLPAPRPADMAAFGLFAGVALGQRVIGLLLFVYVGLVILLQAPWRRPARDVCGFVAASARAFVPAAVIAYLLMVLAWPWAALDPLNPLRALVAFSEFHYQIRTVLAGQVYEMASVPRLYVPIYILVRVPLLTLAAAGLALLLMLAPPRWRAGASRREVALVAGMIALPLGAQVICHGPAFTGLRHFLFVLPVLAILAGIGLHLGVAALAARGPRRAASALAVITAVIGWDAATLVRLHPYEYLFYNPAVGGLAGASRRYATDYWVNIMPAAVEELESYLARTELRGGHRPPRAYTVAVCGERISFEHAARTRLLQWTSMQRWEQADFFIAPTHMNCDRILDGRVVVTIQRLGVPIGYVKDRRGLNQPPAPAR